MSSCNWHISYCFGCFSNLCCCTGTLEPSKWASGISLFFLQYASSRFNLSNLENLHLRLLFNMCVCAFYLYHIFSHISYVLEILFSTHSMRVNGPCRFLAPLLYIPFAFYPRCHLFLEFDCCTESHNTLSACLCMYHWMFA